MLIRLDTTVAHPLYLQITREVRRAIVRGEVRAGERLPAARELAHSLGVNMHTVLRAYAELRDAGDIELRRGRGAVVLPRSDLHDDVASAVQNLLEVARRRGISLEELHHSLDEGAFK